MAYSAARFPRAAFGGGALAGVVAAAGFGSLPILLAAGYLGLSAVSYLMYRADKAAARASRRRTPETSLHLVDMLGGWPGALVAQQQFRHKTAKQPFQTLFWLTVILNLAAAGWLVWP
ncbi:DUF1294 domain-containing protein [Arenimonas aestuarii]